jgi:hypothetical protein
MAIFLGGLSVISGVAVIGDREAGFTVDICPPLPSLTQSSLPAFVPPGRDGALIRPLSDHTGRETFRDAATSRMIDPPDPPPPKQPS